MSWTLIIIIMVIVIFFVAIKNGNQSFWKLVSKDPDFFYDNISNNKNWIIINDNSIKKDRQWVGPFRLFIPKLNKMILFYGIHPFYLEDQKKIIQELKERT